MKPWLDELPPSLKAEWRSSLLSSLIDTFVPEVLAWLLSPDSPNYLVYPNISANQLVAAFLSLLEALLLKDHTRESLAKKELEELDKKEAKEAAALLGSQQVLARPGVAHSTLAAMGRGSEVARAKKNVKVEFINLFLMAAAWGFGALIPSENAKIELSELLIRLAGGQEEIAALALEEYGVPVPGMNLHDYFVDFDKCGWTKWKDLLSASPRQDQSLNSDEPAILIPTEDTLRYSFLASQLIKREMPVCLLGGTGTGKTSIMKEILENAEEKDGWNLG